MSHCCEWDGYVLDFNTTYASDPNQNWKCQNVRVVCGLYDEIRLDYDPFYLLCFYSWSFVSFLRYWLTNNIQIKRPTTGLLMYTMATRFCEEIHLYGFWPFPRDSEGKPVKYHYYDTLKYHYTSSSSPHTMPLEFRTLSTLHRQGALRLHTGSCKLPTWSLEPFLDCGWLR